MKFSSPVRKAWAFVGMLVRPSVARKLGTLVTEGYLAETGWTESVRTSSVVDRLGSPIPWATYPSIDFLISRLDKNQSVFEYGAGASTLFFARHTGRVTAVEHDEKFAEYLRPRLQKNVNLLGHEALSDAYVMAIRECGEAPDIVSVDGRNRVRCIQAAEPYLSARGVLILDDAEREEYREGICFLKERGYRSVEFWGLAPGMVERKCTSIFYRSNNVLGL